jgi:hypothetical protein
MAKILSIIATAQSTTYSLDKVGIDNDLAFTTNDVIQKHSGYFLEARVQGKTVNGIYQGAKITFIASYKEMHLTALTSALIEDELQYASKVSASTSKVVFLRPEGTLSRTGKATKLPSATFTYTATETGSTKTIRQETKSYQFALQYYTFMANKTEAQIAAENDLDSVRFDPRTPFATQGTNVLIWASPRRIAKDVFFLFGTENRLWDKIAITTTSVTALDNQIHSVYPHLDLIGDTLYNTTFINETWWKNYPIAGKLSVGGNSTYTGYTYTYRLKLLNGCKYTNMTESQAILGYGMAGQCESYSDFYYDDTEKNCVKWALKTSTTPRIDRVTNTIYYDPSKNAIVMIETTVAPKSNPNAKTWADDTALWIQGNEQHSDVFGWFGAILAK